MPFYIRDPHRLSAAGYWRNKPVTALESKRLEVAQLLSEGLNLCTECGLKPVGSFDECTTTISGLKSVCCDCVLERRLARRKKSKALKASDYPVYMKSLMWRETRQSFIESDLFYGECYACGDGWGHGDHVHHRTYSRLGAEELSDLVPLCETCHDRVHTAHAKIGSLWRVTNRVVAQTRETLGLNVLSEKFLPLEVS